MTTSQASALLDLGLALGRIESRLADPDHARALEGWFLRDQGAAIAAAEGHGTDRVRLAAVLADIGNEISDPSLRTARDAIGALRIVLSWQDSVPTAADVRAVWEASTASQMLRSSPESIWQIDQDCASFAAAYALLGDEGGPERLAETVMRLHCHIGFRHKAARMTRLLLPSLIRIGLRCTSPFIGAAREMAEALAELDALPSWDLNVTRGGTSDPDLQDRFHEAVLVSIARSSSRIETASAKVAGLRKEMLHAYAGRSQSKAPAAIVAFLAEPVFTTARLSTRIGTTVEGARHIVDRFRASEHVSVFGEAAGKNQGFVCQKALSL